MTIHPLRRADGASVFPELTTYSINYSGFQVTGFTWRSQAETVRHERMVRLDGHPRTQHMPCVMSEPDEVQIRVKCCETDIRPHIYELVAGYEHLHHLEFQNS